MSMQLVTTCAQNKPHTIFQIFRSFTFESKIKGQENSVVKTEHLGLRKLQGRLLYNLTRASGSLLTSLY